MVNEIEKKVLNAKSPEELLAIIKEAGKEITIEQAKEAFQEIHAAEGEMTDDALENIAGGKVSLPSLVKTLIGN